jgi:hypothetical protein
MMFAFVVLVLAASSLEEPRAVRSWVVQKSEVSAGNIVTACRVYRDVAVVETNDPGVMGAAEIVVRKRGGASVDASCARKFVGETLKVELPEPLYLDGVQGPWLVLKGADGFGAEMTVAIVDTRTGREVLRDTRHLTEDLSVTASKDSAHAEYFRALRLDCDPRKHGCFARARKTTGIPDDVKLDLDLTSCPSEPIDTLQLGVPVRRRLDLSAPDVFLAGRVSCAVAP